MSGLEVIEALKKKFRVETDAALAKKLGITAHAVLGWKKRKKISPGNVARLTLSASRAGARALQDNAIRPLVEFFPISRSGHGHGGSTRQLFSVLSSNGQEHAYRQGLKQEMMQCHGVYVFFDSRGQAIYAGKARRQSLWKEMNLAFNRSRGGVQRIRRVQHPNRGVPYRDSNEKARQIEDLPVPLWELAAYFSAYHVEDCMVDDLEALLVRSFANDLLNIRMEKFSRHRQ